MIKLTLQFTNLIKTTIYIKKLYQRCNVPLQQEVEHCIYFFFSSHFYPYWCFLWLTVHYSNKPSLRSNLELSVSLKGTAEWQDRQMKNVQFMRSFSESAFEPATFVFQPFIHYVPPIHDDTAPFSWVTTTVYFNSLSPVQLSVWWKQWSECIIYCVVGLCTLYLH